MSFLTLRVARADLGEVDRLQGEKTFEALRLKERADIADELVRGWWAKHAGEHLVFRGVRAAVRFTLVAYTCAMDANTRRISEIQALVNHIAAQGKRVAALEETALHYQGVHENGKAYGANAAVTFRNGLWIAQRATCDGPGESADWKLAARGAR